MSAKHASSVVAAASTTPSEYNTRGWVPRSKHFLDTLCSLHIAMPACMQLHHDISLGEIVTCVNQTRMQCGSSRGSRLCVGQHKRTGALLQPAASRTIAMPAYGHCIMTSAQNEAVSCVCHTCIDVAADAASTILYTGSTTPWVPYCGYPAALPLPCLHAFMQPGVYT